MTRMVKSSRERGSAATRPRRSVLFSLDLVLQGREDLELDSVFGATGGGFHLNEVFNRGDEHVEIS